MNENINPQPSQKMGIVIGVIVVLLVVVALFILAGRGSDSNTTNTNLANIQNTTTNLSDNSSVNTTTNATANSNDDASGSSTPKTVTIDLSAEDFAYSKSEIRVSKGDTVKINLTSLSGTHNFTIDELNVRSSNVTEGNSAEVEFPVTEDGSFTYYCSVDSHRDLGLRGTLIVE